MVAIGTLLLAGVAPSPGSATPFSPQPSVTLDIRGTYAIRVFRDAEGLPQNTVHAIALDREGMLWVGTQDGAAFYDGRSWTRVAMPEALRSNFVRAILPTRDGSLWFGTQAAGLCRLSNGRLEAVAPLGDSSRSMRVNALMESTAGAGGPTLWVATHDHGLLRLDADGWTRFDSRSGLPSDRIWALAEAGDDKGRPALWVGTNVGLSRLTQGAAAFESVPGFAHEAVNSFATSRARDGSAELWVGTYGDGLFRYSQGAWQAYTAREGLPSQFVTSLAWVDSGGGELWVGTDGGGVVRLHGGEMRSLDTRHGLPASAIYSLLAMRACDGAAAVWVGTRNGGLARVMSGRWQALQPVPSPAPLPATAFAEVRAADGSPVVFVATDGGGVARLAGDAWTLLGPTSQGQPRDTVTCLLGTASPGKEPVLWVGTRNGGLARFERGAWTVVDKRSGALPSDLVLTLLEAPDGAGGTALWVGTRAGLARMANGRWTRFGRADGLPDESVQSLAVTTGSDGAPTVWAGTGAGLARLREGRWQAVALPPRLQGVAVQALAVAPPRDGRRELWVGLDGAGIAVLDLADDRRPPVLIDETSSPALPNNVVYHIMFDRQQRAYVLTNRGVARLAPQARASAELARWETTTFTIEDGLPLNQCVRGAGMVDSQGRLWVGTVAGAAVLDPADEASDESPKRLQVQAFVQTPSGPIEAMGGTLAAGQGWPFFDLRLMSFYREADTRYRTQLVGVESLPGPWTADPRRELLHLNPGRYLLRAWGRDWAGNVSGPVEHVFVVQPGLLENHLVQAGAATMLVLGLWAAYRLRRRFHSRREERLRELMEARTRELREANEILQELSYLDPLTGIGNRRRFDDRLDTEFRRGVRARSALSLVMVDIDFFKPYNDTYGHPQGDACLKAVATALADGLGRVGDSVARYGGEEFAVILPSTDRRGAIRVADNLRSRVEALAIPHAASRARPVVTISCGVSTVMPAVGMESTELIRLADESLYRAKQAGRNRTRADHSEPRSSQTSLPKTISGDDSGGSSGPVAPI